MPETYLDQVRDIERSLGPFAFRSDKIETFTNGVDAIKWFEEEWRRPDGNARYAGRTPIMLERDRILFSDELRRLDDKSHLLFYRNQRVSRVYTAHTRRMVHVARAICGRLGLNADLAEAIAWGCKVGGTPFLHVSKKTVDEWIQNRLRAIDDDHQPRAGARNVQEAQGTLVDVGHDGRTPVIPIWLQHLRSESVRSDVARYIPWAFGNHAEPAYSSGQQSYWLLSTNPFLLTPTAQFVPQTMYGIWRHSLAAENDFTTFRHEIQLTSARLTLSDSALTHEAVVVRYADDITWVIENLSEANRAAALFGERNAIFTNLAVHLNDQEMPDSLARGLLPVANAGRLYTYFIDDLIRTSSTNLREGTTEQIFETEPRISLSSTAARMLRLMKGFLETNVFSDSRIRARNATLRVISETVLELLYAHHAEALVDLLRLKARVEGWSSETLKTAEQRLTSNATHRVQACVDAFSLMSDNEVFDFLGLEGG